MQALVKSLRRAHLLVSLCQSKPRGQVSEGPTTRACGLRGGQPFLFRKDLQGFSLISARLSPKQARSLKLGHRVQILAPHLID